MSIALERGTDSIEGSVFVKVVPFPQEIAADRRFSAAAGPLLRPPEAAELLKGKAAVEEEDGESGSCSSSIGRDSDCSGVSDGGDVGEPEVQSTLKGPLDAMDELQDSLPIWRGISNFYCGKSISFTSLEGVSSSSCTQHLAKPEDLHARKRKSLLSFSNSRDRCHNHPMRGNIGWSTAKRPANSNWRTFPPAHGTSSSDSNSREDRDLSRRRPPLHRNGKASGPCCGTPPKQRCSLSVRSFSLTDLQDATTSISSWRSTRDSNN